MIKKLLILFRAYMGIGFALGLYLWFADPHCTAKDLYVVPVIAMLWPLWLYLLLILGG